MGIDGGGAVDTLCKCGSCNSWRGSIVVVLVLVMGVVVVVVVVMMVVLVVVKVV